MAKKVIELPFLRGQDEGVDPKLLYAVAPQGTLARAVNVRLRRDGRLGTRRDYTTLSATTYNGQSLVAYDVANFDGRLVAFGDTRARGYASDVYEYVTAAATWSGTEGVASEVRLGQASMLRDLGRLPSSGQDTTYLDVAATGGYVCLVSSDSVASYVHLFRADTGQTLFAERSTTALFRPRVVAIGASFYIGGLPPDLSLVELYSVSPASQTGITLLSTPFASGDAIEAWDLTANVAGTELVMAAARDTPASEIRRVNTAGATQQTITGPADLLDFCSVYNDGTRVHFVDVVDTTRIVRLSTYLVATGALENGPTTLFSSGTTLQQVAVQRRSANQIRAVCQLDTSAAPSIAVQDITAATHVLSGVDSSWRNTFLTTKALARPVSTTLDGTYFGGRYPDPDCTNILAIQNTEQVLAATEHYTAAETLGQLPHLARDSTTGRGYWPKLVQDQDQMGVALVSEWGIQSSERFQTASIGGHLYLALSTVLAYDGRLIVESGFEDIPVITSVTPSNGSGSLTPTGVYSVAVTWEWLDALGHFHSSAPSAVSQVTMGASDDTITVVVSTPHSIRRNETNQDFGSAVKVVVWCSVSNGTVLQRAAVAPANNAQFGDNDTLTVLGPDATIREQAVLYTQGGRGALSGPLPFECPLPARYIWASKERLLIGGLPTVQQVQESRPLFPNEPIQWSLGIGFFTTVRGAVTAVAILDETRYVFTAREIFSVPGEGIDDTGNGTLGPPVKLPSDGGCIDWRSVVETSEGLFFQLDTDKIYLLPRGGTSPVWIGQPVRTTLESYPVITSASICTADQCVYFTCNNGAGTDGRIVVYDLRAQTWYVDVPLTAETYRSGVGIGTHVLVKAAGTIHQQQTSETPSTFIPVELETPDIYPAGNDGWSNIYGCSALLEYRGNFVIELAYSIDCGVTYRTARTYQVSGLAVGTRVRKTWTFGPFQTDSVRLRFRTSALSGAATAGCVWHSYGILAEPVEGLARVEASDQG